MTDFNRKFDAIADAFGTETAIMQFATDAWCDLDQAEGIEEFNDELVGLWRSALAKLRVACKAMGLKPLDYPALKGMPWVMTKFVRRFIEGDEEFGNGLDVARYLIEVMLEDAGLDHE